MDTTSHETIASSLRLSGKAELTKPFYTIGYHELSISSTYQYETPEGTKYGVMSRERTDDMLDTVLSKMCEAPAGTFASEDQGQDNIVYPAANAWLEEQVSEYLSHHTPETIV